MSSQVFLSTTGTLATVVIDDLGGVTYVHPVVSLPLVSPAGEFTYEEVINSTETPGAVDSASLQASLNAGHITLTDASGNPISDLTTTTLPVATPTNEGIVSTVTQSFGGDKTFNDRVTIGDAGISSPYLLSVQDQDNDGFAYIEILSDRTGSSFGGFDKGAFFGIEDYGNNLSDQWFSLYNWQGGPIVFWTDTIASSGVQRFRIENNGVLNVGNTVDYETLIGADDDIPNIKYLNDAITTASGAGALQFEWRFNTSLSGDPGTGRYAYDNATPASVTEIRVSDETFNGVDINNILAAVEVGDRLYFQTLGDSTAFILGTVNATPVDNTTYWSFPVTVEDSGVLPSNNSKGGGIIVLGSNTIVDLGVNTTINSVEITNTAGTNATLPAATGSLAGIVTAEAQTIGGAKTFDGPDNGNIILNAPTPSNSLIIGHDTTGAPDCWGISQSGLGFYFCLGYNSVNPQLVLGATSGAGIAYIDADFARPIYLNALPTGTGQGVGGRGEVLVGQAGLTVGSLNAAQAPNLRLTTVDGGTDWNIYLGSPANFDNWLRFSAVGSGNSNEAVLLPDGEWRVQNGSAGSPGHGFLNASNYGMYLGGTNDVLCFATAGIPRLNVASNGVLDVGSTVDYETLIGADDDIPNIAYLNAELAALDWNDLNNVDETGKITGSLAYWNGTNWVPTEGVNDAIRLLQNGCIAEFIDTTGLDFCNTQIGPVSGSAFFVGRRALGTIAVPTAILDGTKIAGYGASAFDGTTYVPSAEMSMYAEGDQTGTNWGSRLEFKVTEENTTTLFNALIIEDDGTLTVRDQTDYENQVTDDDDIPNAKWVLDQFSSTDQPAINYITTVSFGLTTTPTVVPIPALVVENETSVLQKNGGDNTRIDILEDGEYLVCLNMNVDAAGAPLVTSRVLVNGTTTLTGSEFVSDPTNNPAAVTPAVVATFSNGDFVQIQAETNTGTGSVEPNSGLSVIRLRGPKGEKGDPGSGSTITLEEDDVVVPGGPHDTINFEGWSFDVTDDTGGQATVAATASFIRVFSDGAGDNTVNYNNVANTIVQLSGGTEGIHTQFTWDGVNNWVVCNFDGWVEASYSVPTTSTGARNSVTSRLVLENVGGTVQTERGFDTSYIRNSSGHTRDTLCNTSVYEVSNGEKVYIWIDRAGSNTSATNIIDEAELIVKRLS